MFMYNVNALDWCLQQTQSSPEYKT